MAREKRDWSGDIKLATQRIEPYNDQDRISLISELVGLTTLQILLPVGFILETSSNGIRAVGSVVILKYKAEFSLISRFLRGSDDHVYNWLNRVSYKVNSHIVKYFYLESKRGGYDRYVIFSIGQYDKDQTYNHLCNALGNPEYPINLPDALYTLTEEQ